MSTFPETQKLQNLQILYDFRRFITTITLINFDLWRLEIISTNKIQRKNVLKGPNGTAI